MEKANITDASFFTPLGPKSDQQHHQQIIKSKGYENC